MSWAKICKCDSSNVIVDGCDEARILWMAPADFSRMWTRLREASARRAIRPRTMSHNSWQSRESPGFARESWLAKMTNAVSQHWRQKNQHKAARPRVEIGQPMEFSLPA